MGFSVTIASAIVLIGLIGLAGTLSTTIILATNSLSASLNSAAEQKSYIRIELEIIAVNGSSVEFLVKNTGSSSLFLKNQSFKWNSVIIAYNNSGWHSFLTEDYSVLEINVTGTNVSFDVAEHEFINPGEQARISSSLPVGAPEIPLNGIVVLVFISHYGASAVEEAVRE